VRIRRSQRADQVFLWVLAAMIVATAGIATYLNEPEPREEFRASVVIAPPTIVQDSPAAVNQFVIDLAEQVESDAMVVHVLEAVPEIDRDQYLRGIEANRRGASSIVDISFVHTDDQIARQTTEAVALRLIDDSARSEYDKTAHLLEQAETRVNEAGTALTEFAETHGAFDPAIEYANVLSEITAIDRQITTATIEGSDESTMESLEEQRAVLVTERGRLGSVLVPYQTVIEELDRARQVLEDARSRFLEAEFEYTTVNTPDELVVSRDVTRFVDDSARLQRAALGAAVALVLTVVLLIPLGLWLRRHRLAGKHRDQGDDRLYDLTVDDPVDIAGRVYERQ